MTSDRLFATSRRIGSVRSCLAVAVASLYSLVPMLRTSHGVDTARYLLALGLGTFGMAIPYRWTRIRLVLGSHEITEFSLFGSRSLANRDVAGFSLQRDSQAAGHGQSLQGLR